LRAPERIPYLYEEAYQWWPSFDDLGEVIQNPNPTPAFNLLSTVFDHLVRDCHWPPHRIHLFGFAQGGSAAAEWCLQWWRYELERQAKSAADNPTRADGDTAKPPAASEPTALGSVVSVSGELLSFPTLSKKCPTPALMFSRPSSARSTTSQTLGAYQRAFGNVTDVWMAGADGMPRSKDEWFPVMKFWSEHLGKRQVEGLYEVMGGSATR